MSDDLHALLTLQQHDTAADQLRHRRAALPERALVAGLEGELARVESRRAAVQAEHDQLMARQGRLEGDVSTAEDKRRGLERRLSSSSVPREAQTMSDEIDGLKARQSGLEDELIEIMEAVEPLDLQLAADGAERTDLHERLAAARAALLAAEAGIDTELASVGAARTQAAAAVPDALRARYDRLRAKLGGVAVATLDGPRCTGCRLVLPTVELERIRAAAPDVVVECEQCGRILVR